METVTTAVIIGMDENGVTVSGGKSTDTAIWCDLATTTIAGIAGMATDGEIAHGGKKMNPEGALKNTGAKWITSGNTATIITVTRAAGVNIKRMSTGITSMATGMTAMEIEINC